MEKIRKLIPLEKLEMPIRKQLLKAYPDGFGKAVMKIDAPTPFYAIRFESPEVSYLVKLSNYFVETFNEDDDDYNDGEVDSDDIESDEDED